MRELLLSNLFFSVFLIFFTTLWYIYNEKKIIKKKNDAIELKPIFSFVGIFCEDLQYAWLAHLMEI